MRGVLAYAAIPALLAAGVAVVVLTWRRSRRDGLVLFGAMAATNVVIQIIKHPLAWSFPAVEMLDPLSGHVGVAGAVALGWALSVRRERRASAAVAAVGVISVVGVGVVLAGWHSVAQVVCPFLVVLGGMTIADGLMSPPRGSTARKSHWPGVLTVPIGVLVAAVSLAVALGGPQPTDETDGLAVLCLVGIVVGLVAAGVGALLLGAPALAHGTASPGASSAPSPAERRPT